MNELEEEILKKKYRNLVDNLYKINTQIKSFTELASSCSNTLKDNAMINNKIYQEEVLTTIKNETRQIETNMEKRVIPNLINKIMS